jgi:hypothetical protein
MAQVRRFVATGPERASIEYRLTPLQRVVPVAAGLLLGLAGAYVMIVADGGQVLAADVRSGLVLVVVGTLTSLVGNPPYGVTLTAESAIVRQWRVRVLDWRSVAGITVERRFGYRVVDFWGPGGHLARLYAPVSMLDDRFDEKVEVIRACWQGRPPWLDPSWPPGR